MIPKIRLLLAIPGLMWSACSPAAPPLFDLAQKLESGENPVFATIADINGDQRPDVLVANAAGNSVSVYFGSSDGLYAAGTIDAGPEPDSIASGDFDEDGDLDIAIANHDTDFITVLLNDGKGAFSAAPGSPVTISVDPHPHVVVAFDSDRDGHLDLLVDDRNGHGYLLLRGQGDGRFTPDSGPIDAGGDPYLGVALGDLNGDGREDLVAPLRRHIGIVLSDEEGYLPPHLLDGGAFGVATANLTGDDALDIVRAPENGPAQVFTGTGDGLFEPAWHHAVPAGAKRLGTGDFNGDGRDDFVLQNFASPRVLIALASQHGFELHWIESGKNPWGLAVADLNGDGRDDLVSVDNANSMVYVFLSRGGN